MAAIPDDDFDPYLQRDEHESPHEWAQENLMKDPVSSCHDAVSPLSVNSFRNFDYQPSDPSEQHVSSPASRVQVEPDENVAPASSTEPTKASTPGKPQPRAGGWWFEILSAILSIVCIVAIIIILVEFDGKRLSSWNWVISPNAVLSILSTAAKAVMILPVSESISQLKWIYLEGRSSRLKHLQVYDSASRGLLGSLSFLWQVKGGVSYVSYLGCVITILAVALDPFTQQILIYSNEENIVPGSQSSVQRSQVYDNGETGVTGASGQSISTSRDSDVIGAAVAGLYGVDATPPFSCPGSNCTFPDFQTLGLCGSVCSDVTPTTIQKCDNHCQDANVTRYGDVKSNCTYKTPSDFKLYSYSYYDTHNGFGHTNLNTTVNMGIDAATSATLLAMGVIRFNNSDELSGDATSCDYEWQDTVKVYECIFDLCALSFEDYIYTNGSLQSGSIRTSKLNMTTSGETIVYQTLNETFPGNQTYTVNSFDIDAITSGLANFFDTATYSEYQTNLFTTALYNGGDIPTTAARMAAAMTYRLMQGPNTTAVHGDMLLTETYIHVQWPWLTLMIALAVLAVVFLLVTIVLTRRARQLAWKSSLAPLLYADSTLLRLGVGRAGQRWCMDHDQQVERINTIRSGLTKEGY